MVAPSPRDHRARLSALADRVEGVELADTALALAGLDRPGATAEDYLDHLAGLGAELAASEAEDADGRAEALATVMARRHRYRGDDQDDDQVSNANLMWVIDHRRGIGPALGIVYLEAARRAGWPADGLSFPGRFLIRVEGAGGDRAILEPFHGGRRLSAPQIRALLKEVTGARSELAPSLWSPLANRDILVRLQNDVKLRLLRCGRVDRALAVVEAVLLFAPGQTALWREAGLMHLRLGSPKPAQAALEQFVSRTTNEPARRRTLQLLQEIRSGLS